MSTVRDITTESDYKNLISSLPPDALVNLFFHTSWAAPCKQMRTFFEALASQHEASDKIVFLAIDAEELPEISESFDVTAVPYVVLVRDGKTLHCISGSNTASVRDVVEREAGRSHEAVKRLPEKLRATPRAHPSADSTVAGGDIQEGRIAAKDLSDYAPLASDPMTGPEFSSTHKDYDTAQETPNDLNAKLESLVKAAPVMLFMKGTPSTPQCGFSRQIIGILRERGVRYGFFNILADEEVRQGLKTFADWPTFPQLWVGGELVGGLDIVKEELESNPEFFDEYSVGKGQGGMAGADQQKATQTAAT